MPPKRKIGSNTEISWKNLNMILTKKKIRDEF